MLPKIGEVFSLVITNKVKRWRFPEDRFVEWGPEDESYCRAAGYGKEEEVDQTISIPNAVVKMEAPERTESGQLVQTLKFRALPNYFDSTTGPFH